MRDVHGFAVRFYTDEGNYDIVGNNIPVFFLQDAMQFPDLIHAVKVRLIVVLVCERAGIDRRYSIAPSGPRDPAR